MTKRSVYVALWASGCVTLNAVPTPAARHASRASSGLIEGCQETRSLAVPRAAQLSPGSVCRERTRTKLLPRSTYSVASVFAARILIAIIKTGMI